MLNNDFSEHTAEQLKKAIKMLSSAVLPDDAEEGEKRKLILLGTDSEMPISAHFHVGVGWEIIPFPEHIERDYRLFMPNQDLDIERLKAIMDEYRKPKEIVIDTITEQYPKTYKNMRRDMLIIGGAGLSFSTCLGTLEHTKALLIEEQNIKLDEAKFPPIIDWLPDFKFHEPPSHPFQIYFKNQPYPKSDKFKKRKKYKTHKRHEKRKH